MGGWPKESGFFVLGLLAIIDEPQVTRTCIHQANAVLSFSGVTFVLFCFLTTVVCVLFRFCFFLFLFYLETFLSTSIFYSYVWRIRHIARFSFRVIVIFYLVTTGWIFDVSILCENSINQKSINNMVLEGFPNVVT